MARTLTRSYHRIAKSSSANRINVDEKNKENSNRASLNGPPNPTGPTGVPPMASSSSLRGVSQPKVASSPNNNCGIPSRENDCSPLLLLMSRRAQELEFKPLNRCCSTSGGELPTTTTTTPKRTGVLKKPSPSSTRRFRIWKGIGNKRNHRKNGKPKKMVVILDQPTIIYEDNIHDEEESLSGSSNESTASTEEHELNEPGFFELEDDPNHDREEGNNYGSIDSSKNPGDELKSFYRKQVEDDLQRAVQLMSLYSMDHSPQHKVSNNQLIAEKVVAHQYREPRIAI